jgi:type I restriction-modification system DNA methylase subunit
LERWGIPPDALFGQNAKLGALREANQRLDEWLNGSIFPLRFGGKHGPKAEHVRLVAGAFEGDDVFEGGEVQLALDFLDYDFSYIPIETLSVVYEQFLHQGKKGKAREKGAYYTPIPVVNFMLSEMEESHPLVHGMKVFDPSCGSGAFLVQAYRQLIEREFPPGSKPKPGDLRELLERHIFGIDIDPDACNVTELSLTLTLLDYIDPPDLEDRRRNFKLPSLRGTNVFEGNFFEPFPEKLNHHASAGFDWIVGNPPWKKLNGAKLSETDRPVWDWMGREAKEHPVGSNQSARAFAWKAGELLTEAGKGALLMPAMTLHDNPARGFRQRFFSNYRIPTIADFSNLAEVLSDGRFRVAV